MSGDQKYSLNQPPVFICGIQRSGTTLLLKMLSRNEQVKFFPQETHLYPLLWKPDRQLSQFANSSELADHLLKRLPEVNFGWSAAMPYLEEVCEELRSMEMMPESVSKLLRVLLHHWQVKHTGSVTTGEKTPAHIYYALEILKEFPECKIVLMCRDPRAVALSEHIKLKTNPRVTRQFNAFSFIVRWSTATDLISALSKRPNICFLKYEDLIRHPEKSIRDVSEFLNIDYAENMLDVGVTNSSFGDKNQKDISFNEDNLVRWKTELPVSTLSLIEKHLGSQMKKLGYELSGTGKMPVKLAQKIKLKAAREVAKRTPAHFHHLNRNKKYRS